MITRIGRYQVQAELGRGGFGRVYRAHDPTVGRVVAIKTLTAGGEPELLTRFRNEASAAGKLRHPNIVIIYDFGDHDGAPYLVMELLDGQDLERILSGGEPLTLLKKLDIMVQAATGLHHAHSHDVVHRDIKPANIMLLADGTVKILDFGIALLTQATAARLTPQGALVGTFPYMAPEQFYAGTSDVLTDIFAFGITCYRLLTGQHPFQAAEMGGLMYNIMHQTPAPIRSFCPECPEALEEAVFKLLAKDRDGRYPNLEDFRFDLEPVVNDLRKESAGQLIVQARRLIDSGQLEAARAVVRQALEADPANRVARDLRKDLHRKAENKPIRPRIAALVNAGRERLESRRFEDAIRRFESAIRLDNSDPALHALIEQARAAWQQAQRAGRLVEEARRALERDDLRAALRHATEASAADPRDAEAKELLAEVRTRVEARERFERRQRGAAVKKLVSDAQALLDRGRPQEATSLLYEASIQYPDESEVTSLLEVARLRLRRQQEQEATARTPAGRTEEVQNAIAKATDLFHRGEVDSASEILRTASARYPEEARLAELMKQTEAERESRRREHEVRKTLRQARELLNRGDTPQATLVLTQASAQYPSAAEIAELLEAVQTRQHEQVHQLAVAKIVDEARRLAAAKQLAQALAVLEDGLKQFPGTESFERLRQTVRAALAREPELAEAGRRAAALLADGHPDDAVSLLESRYADEPAVRDLLARARQAVADRKRDALLQRAVKLGVAAQYEEALRAVSEAVRLFGPAEAASEVQRNLEKKFEQKRRREARQADQARLAAIEREVESGAEKPRLRELQEEARRIAAGYGADPEIAASLSRIDERVEQGLAPWFKRLKSRG